MRWIIAWNCINGFKFFDIKSTATHIGTGIDSENHQLLKKQTSKRI